VRCVDVLAQLALASLLLSLFRWFLLDNDLDTEPPLLIPSAIATCQCCGGCVYCWESDGINAIGKCLACNLLIVVQGEKCEYFHLPAKENS
jgi:hypothetical protein